MIDKIRKAIAWARKQGYIIVPGNWGIYYKDDEWCIDHDNDSCVCPLAALLLMDKPVLDDIRTLDEDFEYIIRDKYQEVSSLDWADGFLHGFDQDGWEYNTLEREASKYACDDSRVGFLVGTQIRKEVDAHG